MGRVATELVAKDNPLAIQAKLVKETYGKSVLAQIQCGRIIYEVKAGLSDKEFELWYLNELGWSKSQTYRTLALHKDFGFIPQEVVGNFALTVLYGLCGKAKKTEALRFKMLEVAKSGKFIDMETLKQNKPDATPKPAKEDWMEYKDSAKVSLSSRGVTSKDQLVTLLKRWLATLHNLLNGEKWDAKRKGKAGLEAPEQAK